MWLELIQGPGARAPRHFTKATRFPVKVEGGRWSCTVANWTFGGAHGASGWTLDEPARAFSRNGDPVPPGAAFEPLDVLMADDELAVRLHALPPRDEPTLPSRWWALPEAERRVLADQLLEAGDSLGELIANPSDALRARWLAVLMLPPKLGEVFAVWNGAGLDELEVKLGGSVRTADVARWLERLPRRLEASRIGAPVRALRLRAPHFSGSTPWAEVLDSFARSIGDHPLHDLARLEVAWAQPVSAQRVCRVRTWDRLRAACPRLA